MGGPDAKPKKGGEMTRGKKKNNEETRCETKKIGRHDARQKKKLDKTQDKKK